MADAPEYVLEPIRVYAEFTLCRARQHGNASPVLVVAPTAEHPLPQSVRRLEHEYSLAAELEPAWAAKPLALTRHEGRTVLVLADPGGEPLDRVLEREAAEPPHLARLLRIAINLATALSQAHQRGLIHKDVKPENVLVDEVGHVSLTGFGIASRLRRERQAPAPPETVAGTLAYMSPEQTGRMNRSIDARTDLYSLGVTLYQMLTGVLPFAAADALEWVHCHIARQPQAPSDRRQVPAPLSAIIMKLLAKNAEERYQTAAGLATDLRRCLLEWESQGRIDAFPLGTQDSPDRLVIPEKLYGRESEVGALLAAFDRVVALGTAELVLVSGYSGVGKSSVVNELHKVLVPHRGLFGAGKFDQYKREIPYATLAQALQTLVRQILVKTEAEVDQWRCALREALGPNGQLIVSLIPEIEFIIGKQATVPDLPPQQARNRFQLVLRRFLGAFATAEHPLALFLDDLQWLDTATLEILERLVTDQDMRHVLLIGAYRDNEVSSAHPLMRTLVTIREAAARVQEVVLLPLGLDEVGRLAAEAMRCERKAADPLAQLIHEKTGGNPFFTIQFMTELEAEGLLRFEPGAATWRWDVDRIHAKGYTANVVDLMLGKLSRFPNATQESLKQLACLGNSADFDLLRVVYEDAGGEMHDQLWEAVRAGLVFRSETSYRFLHDRVQEAAYLLIPEHQRAQTHLRIGRILLEHTSRERLEEAIFDIVNQLNRGSGLITDGGERGRAAGLNLIAGKRAKASTAYASALRYLHAGRSLLREEDWERNYDLIFSLESLTAECELHTADMVAAESRLTMLSGRARSHHDFSIVTRLQVTLYTTLDRSDRAIEVFLAYLRRNGTDWSPHPLRDDVMQEYRRIWSLVGNRQIEELIDLPLLDDPDVLDMLDVFTEIVHPAMFFDEHLSTLLVCRMVSLCLEHGNCDASCFGYVWFGMFAGPRFDNYTDGFRFGQLGHDLVEKRNLTRYHARTYISFGTLTPWAKHAVKGRELVRRAFEVAYRTGDLTFSAYSWHELITNYLMVGDPLPMVQSEAEKGLDFVKKAGFGLVAENCAAQLGLIRTLRGLTSKFGYFDAHDYSESETEARLAGNPVLALAEFFYWTRNLQGRFFAGEFASAVEASRKAYALLWPAASQLETGDFRFYAALAHAAAWNSASAEERQKHFAAVRDHQRQLETWAQHCPANFETKTALVSAEIARMDGRLLDAEDSYEVAIRSAHDNGFAHCEAVSNECAAQFYSARGFTKIADVYWRDARDCYLRWGANAKVRQLEEWHPKIRTAKTSVDAGAILPSVEQLDLATVIRVSEAVSGEIEQQKLIDTLMRAAIEHAGAERGLLILLPGDTSGGEPQVEAEAATRRGRVEVVVRQVAVTPSDLPEAALHYLIRTHEAVLLDDASADSVYSKDEYVRVKRAKSILCLPIIKQTRLIGALYLENNLTSRVFTPERVTALRLLASQAAMSLDNARLYTGLQRSEAFLAQGQKISHTGSFGWSVATGEIHWSEEIYNILEYDRTAEATFDLAFHRVHPDDRDFVKQTLEQAIREKSGFDIEHRLLMPDRRIKHVHIIGRAVETGNLDFVGAVTDVTAAKQAQEKIRQSEKEARQLLDLSPLHITELGPDGARLYTNRASLDYYGITLDGWKAADLQEVFAGLVTNELPGKFRNGLPFEYEVRLKRKDGQYRWFHYRLRPMADEQGRITRWYAAGTDIEELKLAEQRLQEENVSLREEIDNASMFEEIVGTSAPLKRVVSRISKVAPPDSSVLITGDTGTGKELVARAIHRRSPRSSRAFVSVNCAAIPRDLIASELFGHEKGAFTGATQRRLGRFELADKGTLFLD
jgi:PAS domain S-box-containing protein